MTGRGLINMNTGLKGINFNLKLKTEKKRFLTTRRYGKNGEHYILSWQQTETSKSLNTGLKGINFNIKLLKILT